MPLTGTDAALKTAISNLVVTTLDTLDIADDFIPTATNTKLKILIDAISTAVATAVLAHILANATISTTCPAGSGTGTIT